MMPLPIVSDGDAASDAAWFSSRPQRHYRLRIAAGGAWIIRRRGSAFLRTFAAALPSKPPASESELETLWYATAWPDLAARERASLATANRQSARGAS
jgi:hypothetical protein